MVQSAQVNKTDYSFIVQGGMFHQLLVAIGLGQPGTAGIRLRAACFVLVTYIPLLFLSLVQGVAYGAGLKIPFLYDVSEATRFLLVGPLLILAEGVLEPWLVQVAKHVRDRLILQDSLSQYDSLLRGIVRLRDSYVAELLLLAGTFVWQWMDAIYFPAVGSASWQALPGDVGPSYAWFWYAFLAKPLIRFLWLRWLWRYLIWSFFLCRLATLRMRVLATHPDRLGGLHFIAAGHSKFSLLALAFGAQAASIFGEQILVAGKTLMSFRYEIVGVVLIVLVIFLSPLLAFTGKLLEAKRAGLFEYGALADEYTDDFHNKWIGGARSGEPVLGTSDIQSLADIGNSYEVVHEMKTCLIDKDITMTFVIATLLPFAPLLLTVYPFDELLNHLLKVVM